MPEQLPSPWEQWKTAHPGPYHWRNGRQDAVVAADGSIFYNAKGICGCIQERKCRASGTTIQVLHVEQAGFDKDDEDYSYVTICLDHGFLVYHQTLSKAIDHAAYPEWCAECQENLR